MKNLIKLIYLLHIVVLVFSCAKKEEENLTDQLRNINDYQKVLIIFEKLIEVDPIVAKELMIEKLKERTDIYNLEKYGYRIYAQDKEIFEKLIEIDPNDPEIYFFRATFLNIGQNQLYDFERAIELDPENYLYYYERANYYNYNRQYSEAISDYYKSIELEPSLLLNGIDINKAPALSIAKLEYAVNNNLNDWLSKITITLNDEKLDVFFSIGFGYRKLMDHNNTILYMTKSINYNKNKAMPFYIRGDAYWAKTYEGLSLSKNDQNAQMAVNDWRQARKINPNIKWVTADSSYQEIDPFDFEAKYRYSNNKQQIYFKSIVIFSFNDGPKYFFKSLQGDTDLVLFSSERIEGLSRGKRVTVYWVHNPNVSILDSHKMNSIVCIVL